MDEVQVRSYRDINLSEIVVYVLDIFVWMLLITVLTTQALQIAGVVESPKGLGEITYTQDNEYNYQVAIGNGDVRGKRQTDYNRSPIIDNIFNIPISTLNAVNSLVQSTRPAFQRLIENAQRRIEAVNAAAATNNQPLSYQPYYNHQQFQRRQQQRVARRGPSTENYEIRNKKYAEGPKVQPDGSSSRVLLNV